MRGLNRSDGLRLAEGVAPPLAVAAPDTEMVPLVLGERVTVGHGVVLHGCRVDDEVLGDSVWSPVD